MFFAMSFDINDLDTDPAQREAEIARLRREDPVHWDEKNEHWLLLRYADVRAASKQPELFSSQPKGPWHLFEAHFSMQALDGPEHRRQRGIASKAFTPRMVRRLGETARETINACIDAVAQQGGCEFVSALASPVPLRLIGRVVGGFTQRGVGRRGAVAPAPEQLEVLCGQTQHVGDQAQRHRRRERADELAAALLDDCVDARVDGGVRGLLQPPHHARREPLRRDPALAPVLGAVERLHREVGVEEVPRPLRLRGEQLGIFRGGAHVGVARQQPDLVLLVPVHRILAPDPRELGVAPGGFGREVVDVEGHVS